MLFLLIVWSLLLPIAFLLGAAWLDWLRLNTLERLGDRLILATWLGILTLSAALLAAVLLTPLTPLVGLVVLMLLLAIALKFSDAGDRLRQVIAALSWRWAGVYGGIVGAIALLFTRPVIFTDFGLYHYQVIQWMAKYGVVPGLGLLHMRFSYSFPTWFTIAAAFNSGVLEARIGPIMGGFALSLIVLHGLICIRRIVEKRAVLADWFVIVATLLYIPPLFLSRYLPISASPDLPVAALTVLLVWSGILATSPDQKNRDFRIPFVFAVCAVACKISALPLILIAGLLLLIWQKWDFRRLLALTSLGLLLLPGIAYGIKTVGLPLAPLPYLRLDLPWSVSIERAEIDRLIIQTWMRWAGFPESMPPNVFPAYSAERWEEAIATWNQFNASWDWVPFWFNREKMPAFMLVSGLVCALLLCVRPLSRSHPLKMRLFVLSIGLGGLLFQVSTAPGVRYGVGYFCLIPAFLVAIACTRNSIFALTGVPLILAFANRWGNPLQLLWTMGITAIAAVVVYLLVLKWRPQQRRLVILALLLVSGILPLVPMLTPRLNPTLLLPPLTRTPAPDALETVQQNNFSFSRPKDGLCWAAPLPCSPATAQRGVMVRDGDRGWAGGFVLSLAGDHFP